MNFSAFIDGRYIQDHFPGIGRYTYNLIDALARVAPNQEFVVLHNPALPNTRYPIDDLAQYANVQLHPINVPTFSFAEQYRLQLEIGKQAPLLFHTPYYIKPYVLRMPSVVTLFDLIPLRYPNATPSWRARLFYRLAVTLAARTTSQIIAPSNSARDDLQSLLDVPAEKISVVPLAADARFKPQALSEVTRVREKYNLPMQYGLSVGINKPHKNLGLLIRAWHASKSDVSLVIAGAWDARYPIQTGDTKNIIFLRNVADADLPALYSGATVFVTPSLYEGFGLTPLEAMACGAPVICSNASSLPEVVGDAALLFDPSDCDGLTSIVVRVLNDPSLRDELRIKSIKRAAQFTWEYTAQETLAVYHRVINQ
jgi:alpha-1,3-rhamnosyl/mannosyltransferase